MNACRHCGRQGRFYRDPPDGYVAFSEWADKMMRTHHQERCPGCQRFTVWKPGPGLGGAGGATGTDTETQP